MGAESFGADSRAVMTPLFLFEEPKALKLLAASEISGIYSANLLGRSPLGAGKRGFFTKNIAPSSVKLNLVEVYLPG
jgi:hypothetical protein